MGTRPVAAVDNLWLHMDTPENLMVIESVMWFDDPVDWERATEVIRRRLVERYPVFHQRPVSSGNPLAPDQWEDVEAFDVADHIVRGRLPEPGGQAELQRYVEGHMSVPLDRDRPLWQMHFLDGYGSGSAVVSRFHHALADGTALARVMLELTDDSPTADLVELEAPARGGRQPSALANALGGVVGGAVGAAGATVSALSPEPVAGLVGAASDGVAGALGGAVTSATEAAADVVRGGLSMASRIPTLADPARSAEALNLASQTPGIAGKLLLHQQPETVFSGRVGLEKRAIWSAPIDLRQIKTAARRNDSTINDVMVAGVAGAIATYLREHGGEPLDLVTMVPVNLRPLDQPLPRELGNKFALVFLDLPIHGADPAQRLRLSRERMDQIKGSPEAVLTFGLIGAIGGINPRLASTMVSFFSAKGLGVTTNVPGPRDARWFAGSRLTGTLGWVPMAGDQSVGTCIFSCDGAIRVGWKTDRTLVPDIERLAEAFDAELAALLALGT